MDTKELTDQINELKISMLQLQRSALIDTQTILQILLSKGLCTLEDLTHVRTRIEKENALVQEINQSIENLGGSLVEATGDSNSDVGTAATMQELQDLIQQLMAVNSK